MHPQTGSSDQSLPGPATKESYDGTATISYHDASDVEVAVAEMWRERPRWASRRIRLELLRRALPWSHETWAVPSARTIDRILIRHGLLQQRPGKRPGSSWKRFERPGPMQPWGIDIVGGMTLVDVVTGELREAKIVTGVDDHSGSVRWPRSWNLRMWDGDRWPR
ncbi:MAG TPA: hypothetical protein VFI30_05165 [Nocardioidaceae bacterium]|nr:hypothetical protein [Nocardioidaceae bacterium]